MPSFARELEATLHNALGAAASRKHEYATLEHLLLALITFFHFPLVSLLMSFLLLAIAMFPLFPMI